MSTPIPKAVTPPKIETLDVNNWLGGTVTALDDGRTPADGLRSSGNVYLEQDGTIRPRPSLQRYGPQPVGTILGEIYPFRTVSGLDTTNYLITLQNVSGTTSAYIAQPSDDTWVECTGATYDDSASARFFQLDDKVLIMNGTDTLSFLDISTSTVTTFDAIDDATVPTIANNGTTDLTTGTTSFTVWYAITANSSVGETTGVSASLSINTERDLWDGSTQSLKITWSAVTDAQSYNIYAAVTADGSGNPTLGLLASGLDAGTLSFTDDGSLGIAVFKTMPLDNSTAGPKASRGVAINGRAWLTGDKNNPYYLWHGGDPGHELDFTPANGGGFVNIGSGTGEIPNVAWNFRSGQGDPEIKCLTKGLNGSGKRYTISSTTLTYGASSFTVWAPAEDYGFSGTDSPDGLIVYNNSTYYPSRDGFKELGTKPQLQNLLDNDSVSQTIQTDLGLLNNNAMDGSCGLGFEGRLYWALPVGSSSNNEIWVLDLDRNGAWMKPWSIAADWMVLVQDEDGFTHHVVLSNNTIYELSYNTKTSDDGVPFATSGTTGLTYFSADGREWARLIRLVIEVLRPQGTINFAVSGFTSAGALIPLGTGSITADIGTNGYGWDEAGWDVYGWDAFAAVPTLVGTSSQDVPIKINKDVRYFNLTWNSTEGSVDYSISRAVAEYVSIGVKNLT